MEFIQLPDDCVCAVFTFLIKDDLVDFGRTSHRIYRLLKSYRETLVTLGFQIRHLISFVPSSQMFVAAKLIGLITLRYDINDSLLDTNSIHRIGKTTLVPISDRSVRCMVSVRCLGALETHIKYDHLPPLAQIPGCPTSQSLATKVAEFAQKLLGHELFLHCYNDLNSLKINIQTHLFNTKLRQVELSAETLWEESDFDPLIEELCYLPIFKVVSYVPALSKNAAGKRFRNLAKLNDASKVYPVYIDYYSRLPKLPLVAPTWNQFVSFLQDETWNCQTTQLDKQLVVCRLIDS
jgi:hypothetical protein